MKIKMTLSSGKKIKLTAQEARELYDSLATIYSPNTWSTWPYIGLPYVTYTWSNASDIKYEGEVTSASQNLFVDWANVDGDVGKINS